MIILARTRRIRNKFLSGLLVMTLLLSLLPTMTLTASAVNPAFAQTASFSLDIDGYYIVKAIGLPDDNTAVLTSTSSYDGSSYVYTYYLSINNNAGDVILDKKDVSALMDTRYKSHECDIFALSSGDIVVVYNKSDSSTTIVTGSEMAPEAYFIILDQSGNKVVNQTQINSENPSNILTRFVSMAQLSNGNIAFSWQRNDNSSIATRVFTTAGTPVTSEALVNSGANAATSYISSNDDGTYMVAYHYSVYNSTEQITTFYCKYAIYNNDGSLKTQGTAYSGESPTITNCYVVNLITLSNGYYAYMAYVNGTTTVYLFDSSGMAKGTFTIDSGNTGWLAPSNAAGTEGFFVPSFDAASTSAINSVYDTTSGWTGTRYIYLNYYDNSGGLQYTTPTSVDSGYVNISSFEYYDAGHPEWGGDYNVYYSPSVYLFSGYSRGVGLIKTDYSTDNSGNYTVTSKLFDMGNSNTAPTLTSISTLTGATEDTDYTITYDDLAAAADEADADGNPISFRVESVSSGTLKKGGIAVTSGTTTLATGESLVWTPAANANGDQNAFTVKAYDGTDASSTAVQVVINVAAENDAPTGQPTISGTAAVGQTLTASTASIADVDGLGTFSYQWQVSDDGSTGWSNIASASTGSNYIVTSSEAAKYVRVAVSYIDSGSTSETVYSTACGPNKTSQAPLVYNDVVKAYGDTSFTYAVTGGSGGGTVTYTSSDTSVATIDSSTGEVTIQKAGTTTLTATKASDATYTEASKGCTLTVNKATLTATVGDYAKTYGNANPIFAVDVTGFVNGETTSTAGGYAAPAASCVANTTTDVGTAAITVSGGAATNYVFNTTDIGTLTINPLALTPTASANNKGYDGNTDTTGTVDLTGIINSDDVTATGSFSFEDALAGTGKNVNVTGIALSGTDKDNYTLGTTSATTTANVNPKMVSVASLTIAEREYDGTTIATINSASLDSVIGGDDVSVDYSGATAVFDNANVGSGKTVNVTGLTLAGTAKDNYSLSSSSYTASGNIVYAGTVLTPYTNVAAGAVLPGASVTLTCGTAGSTIYYTTNGDIPTTSSTQYTGAITVMEPTTIKAIAVKVGVNDSSIMEASYTITPTVTTADSTELASYIDCPYVSTINLVPGIAYDYDGTTISRELTINGNGTTINIGTGIDGTLVKRSSGVPDATGKVFLKVSGTSGVLRINNATLQNGSTLLLCGINVKAGGSLTLDSVHFKDFYANPVSGGAVNNFGVHAEPDAVSTTIRNCVFDSSNAIRNAVAIRGGTALITNNTFTGTANPERLNNTDGYEYGIYLYGGTSTISGNTMSGYDGALIPGYLSSPIATAAYYDINATITGNTLTDNTVGMNLVAAWHTLSGPSIATINGTVLDSSEHAFTIGEVLTAANTFSDNTEGNMQLSLDQNDYYTDNTVTPAEDYGTPAYFGGLLSLGSKTSSSVTLTFSGSETAKAAIANQKSFEIQVSADNGATWTAATTTGALDASSTGATVNLASGKTYLLRAALTITSYTMPAGSLPDVYTNADISCYSNAVGVTITSGSSSSSGSSNSSGAAVIVNGESKTAGTSQTTTNSNGQKVTTVKVDSAKLQKILASEKNGATVTLPVTGNPSVAIGVLTGAMVKDMEQKESTLVVQTNSGTYTLPASEINIDAVSQQLGTSVSLADISVTVSIAEPSDSMTQIVANAAADGKFTVMVPAVDFTITCTHGNRTVNVSSFNAYVERTIAIPDGVDPAKITTGVVVDPDGAVHHVPTRITVINGKYYAVINSLTNSTYSVIWNPVEFSDVNNHWAKDSINNMGSRMVVTGIGNNTYEPDRNMTRAEFAAIMIRALGLEPGTSASSFSDVSASDWYSGYIDTAASYGIIKGYSDDAFGPNDTITREQAMTMIARAMKLTGLDANLTDGDAASLIGAYADAGTVSDYATAGVAACLKTGVVSGTGNHTLAPKSFVTRAEVATMVERLLQKSGLI